MAVLRIFILAHEQARDGAADYAYKAPDGTVVQFKEPTRTGDQNAAQWPILQAFSKQLLWPVNGHMVTMTDEEWKDVLTAAFKREAVRLAMGLDGGVVMLGMRTSTMPKKQFSDWLDFLNAMAVERGVKLKQTDQ